MTGYEMEKVDEIISKKKVAGELLKVSECPHDNVVKEYFGGTHSDNVCLDCGMKSLIKNDFDK